MDEGEMRKNGYVEDDESLQTISKDVLLYSEAVT